MERTNNNTGNNFLSNYKSFNHVRHKFSNSRNNNFSRHRNYNKHEISMLGIDEVSLNSTNDERNNLLSIKASINNTDNLSNVILDTGCSRNLIDFKNITNTSPLSEKIQLISLGGSVVNPVGISKVTIKINNITIGDDALVVKNLSKCLILGHDFLSNFNAIINYNENTLSFFPENSDVVTVNFERPNFVVKSHNQVQKEYLMGVTNVEKRIKLKVATTNT